MKSILSSAHIFDELNKAIWEVTCAARVNTLEGFKAAFFGFWPLDYAYPDQIEFPAQDERPWYCFWCDDTIVIYIELPIDNTYLEIRDLIEASIADGKITDESPANSIVGTYEYLSTLALNASCFYAGDGNRER